MMSLLVRLSSSPGLAWAWATAARQRRIRPTGPADMLPAMGLMNRYVALK